MSSQLCFVVTPMDKKYNANVAHFSSFKSKKTTRILLAAELFVVVRASDFALTIRIAVASMIWREVPLTIYTGSRSPLDGLVGMNSTTEKATDKRSCGVKLGLKTERNSLSYIGFLLPKYR